MMRRIKWFQVWGLCLVIAGLSGCASLGTYNPATGRNEFVFIPTSAEVEMGNSMHSRIIPEYPLSTDAAQVSRLQRISQRLVQVSDRQDLEYQFYLVKAQDINAFTTPGGRIYVFDKLAEKLTSDDDLAAVVAHEMGHCSARHVVKKIQAAMGYNLVANFLFSRIEMSAFVRQVTELSANSVIQLVFSAYSRQDEYEADRLSLKYLRLANFDMQAMVRVLELLEKESQGPKIPLILRTHPYVSDRILAARAEIGRLQDEGSGSSKNK